MSTHPEPPSAPSAPKPAPGTLYCIPTPIANDHPLSADLPAGTMDRAAGIDYVIAENAKTARAFLKRLPLTRPIQSIEIVELTDRTPDALIKDWLHPLRAGRDAALVSEAGCPAVADPGARVVWAAHEAGIPVMPMIGPSALLLALMGSGLNGQCFGFVGYLPTEPETRRQRLRALEQRSRQHDETILFIETPYRNAVLAEALLQTLNPNTRLCIAANLSGVQPMLRTQSIAQWRQAPPTLERVPTIFAFLAR